jgi:hypothetical protein
MAEKTLKIVDFSYCNKCAHKDVYEGDEPCNTCLCSGVNENSVKPVNYVPGKGKKYIQSFIKKVEESCQGIDIGGKEDGSN